MDYHMDYLMHWRARLIRCYNSLFDEMIQYLKHKEVKPFVKKYGATHLFNYLLLEPNGDLVIRATIKGTSEEEIDEEVEAYWKKVRTSNEEFRKVKII